MYETSNMVSKVHDRFVQFSDLVYFRRGREHFYTGTTFIRYGPELASLQQGPCPYVCNV